MSSSLSFLAINSEAPRKVTCHLVPSCIFFFFSVPLRLTNPQANWLQVNEPDCKPAKQVSKRLNRKWMGSFHQAAANPQMVFHVTNEHLNGFRLERKNLTFSLAGLNSPSTLFCGQQDRPTWIQCKRELFCYLAHNGLTIVTRCSIYLRKEFGGSRFGWKVVFFGANCWRRRAERLLDGWSSIYLAVQLRLKLRVTYSS